MASGGFRGSGLRCDQSRGLRLCLSLGGVNRGGFFLDQIDNVIDHRGVAQLVALLAGQIDHA